MYNLAKVSYKIFQDSCKTNITLQDLTQTTSACQHFLTSCRSLIRRERQQSAKNSRLLCSYLSRRVGSLELITDMSGAKATCVKFFGFPLFKQNVHPLLQWNNFFR